MGKASLPKRAVRAYGRAAWKTQIKGSTSKKKVAARGAAGSVASDAYAGYVRKAAGITRKQQTQWENKQVKRVGMAGKAAVRKGKSAARKVRKK